MFALTEIVKDKLFGLAESNGSDVFHQCFDNWQDVSWLYNFFKAYGYESGKSFLRLYAIRLNDGAYIVVGGLIKTTQALQDCEEGKQILNKLKTGAAALRKSNLYDAFDIGELII